MVAGLVYVPKIFLFIRGRLLRGTPVLLVLKETEEIK